MMIWTKKSALNNITLTNIEKKMYEKEFDSKFIEELIGIFEKSITEYSQKTFQERMYNLHFHIPAEFQKQEICIKLYQVSQLWIEKEVTKLENETKLSWEVQTEDIQNLDDRVKKTQLVIRHRLTEIVLDLLN